MLSEINDYTVVTITTAPNDTTLKKQTEKFECELHNILPSKLKILQNKTKKK